MLEPFPSKKPQRPEASLPSYSEANGGRSSIDIEEKDMKIEKAAKQSKMSALKSLFKDKTTASPAYCETGTMSTEEEKAALEARRQLQERISTQNRSQMRFGS
ncbi:hypothetical protein Slin15195_G052800 [Septoria linicola]|uniref:Uncharacterized protein n=1 Tax=Septoria linicola TaxID=215465 RepID=A0A9Q9EHM3_9PEZI|nr:hypothetical protein Slin14017_G123590 [Septoria linicola]USW51961.1 hypothetical protein Slin15195_G052800 [Septoria linicola]